MKVMIVVTHLLGTGHLTRAITLAQAIAAAGHTPLIVSGGLPDARLEASEIAHLQLPPVRSDGVDFTRLLDVTGALVDSDHLHARSRQLIDCLTDFKPDAVITELFPFGRRILKEEFTAFLQATQTLSPRPVVFASVRDILAPPSKPKKVLFAEQMITTYYDAVLVHSDPDITPLSQSWPVSDALAPYLHYTGFVAPPPAGPHPDLCGAEEIIVSAGGGAVGRRLFDCAVAAAGQDPSRIWRLLVGGQHSEATVAVLQTGAPANVIAQGIRPDFRQMLHHAAASVSFCGYNTALDILQTTCPAVFVPFDEGNEVEQTIRATALAEQPGIERISAADLTPEHLLSRLDNAVGADKKRQIHTQMYGAERTVEILCDTLRDRHVN